MPQKPYIPPFVFGILALICLGNRALSGIHVRRNRKRNGTGTKNILLPRPICFLNVLGQLSLLRL